MQMNRLGCLMVMTGLLAGCSEEPERRSARENLPTVKEQLASPESWKHAPGPEKVQRSRWAKERDPYRIPFHPPTTEPKVDAKITVGMSRAELLDVLGRCAERPFWLPQAPSRRMVEVFQPANPGCQETFGKRNFQVIHGKVTQVSEGLVLPAMPPATPKVDS